MTRVASQSDVLKRILQEEEIIVFLGAGASWDSGLPMGNGAAKKLVEACFIEAGLEEVIPDEFESDSESESVRWPRFEVVLDILSRHQPTAPTDIVATFLDAGLASTHQLLASLPARVNIVTTNFDDQMERAFSSAGKPYRAISTRSKIQDLDRIDESWILKLHGDRAALDPNTDFGVTIEQILRDFPRSASEAIKRATFGKALILVGYSASDPDLSQLLREIIVDASAVAWIALETGHKNAQPWLELNANSKFYATGSPGAFCDALGIAAPTADRRNHVWPVFIRPLDTHSHSQFPRKRWIAPCGSGAAV